ncbi:hypothetical protein M9H77_17440 [Catharanthus roseus]|uniref:Uncharacterized protein n=1 Tax=Catharanthus roseus TaxID=4058 RepID=A0ACC0B4M8_CATRO|nr:hypothetical protein M9H77_17440 [Catharanthus roseus]
MEEVQGSNTASIHNMENQIGKLTRMIIESPPINKLNKDAKVVTLRKFVKNDPLFIALQQDSQTEVDFEEVRVLIEKLKEAKEEEATTTKEELKMNSRLEIEHSGSIKEATVRSGKTIKKRRLFVECARNTVFAQQGLQLFP